MKYQSTRGTVTNLRFEDVVLAGYACDGGMFMPMTIPKLSAQTIESWASLSYPQIVKNICKLYIEDEIPEDDINTIIEKAFNTFADPLEPIKPVHLSNKITLLEMFHGKSLSFKDLSMSCAANFIEYFLQKNKTRTTILIATSGDTGSSVLEAVRTLSCIDVVVVLPKGRISQVQELQMTTVTEKNCHIIRADGTSDDTDIPMKRIFCDKQFVELHHLSSLNSVNWCRMMVQIAHHFYAYFQGRAAGDPDRHTCLFIPTGGLGNAAAASVARQMGLPLRIVCSVTNDACLRAVQGDYSTAEVYVSIAPAINIQIPYNWERILYILSDMDTSLVKECMTQFETEGKTTSPSAVLHKLEKFMEVKLISDDDIRTAIKRCHDENNQYLVCPHTATALSAAHHFEKADQMNIVVCGVASPYKFADCISELGLEVKGKDLLSELRDKPCRYTDWESTDDWSLKLRQLVTEISESYKTA